MELIEERIYPLKLNEKPSPKQGGGSPPTVGEVVLLVGDKRNQGEWRTGRVPCLAQSKDVVVGGSTVAQWTGH